MTTRAHGAGRVTRSAPSPNPALARALMAWVVDNAAGAPEKTPWRRATPTQTVTSATNRHGERVRFIHNWSWEPSSFLLPCRVTDAATEEKLAEGTSLELGPWDVRVLLET